MKPHDERTDPEAVVDEDGWSETIPGDVPEEPEPEDAN